MRHDRWLNGFPDSTSRTTPRSARRQMVQAMSEAEATVSSPGSDQSASIVHR